MKLSKPKRMTWIFIVSAATAILALVSGYLQYKEKLKSSQDNLKKEEEINKLNRQIIEELKGGDLSLAVVENRIDKNGQAFISCIHNHTNLPI